jgi:hypothetical protein
LLADKHKQSQVWVFKSAHFTNYNFLLALKS